MRSFSLNRPAIRLKRSPLFSSATPTCKQALRNKQKDFSDQHHVVVGLGQTGLSAVRYCVRQDWPVSVTDSRLDPPGLAELPKDVPVALGGWSSEWIQSADRLIVSPGVSLQEPLIAQAIAQGIPCVGDIELFAQHVDAPIIAMTGSNAKSTVTSMVGDIAQAVGFNVKVGGNIGVPVLDWLAEPIADWYILELSSFQLETTYSLRARVAVVLNVSEDHMNRYVSLADYRAAKMRIYEGCQTAVVNLDDPTIWPDDVTERVGFGQAQTLPIELVVMGQHNELNALAALAISRAAGFDPAIALQTLQAFQGLPHRCQFVRERCGVKWYNDSKGTNVGATVAAIQGLSSPEKHLILIAGGRGKGADFSPLIAPIQQFVKETILLGEAADELETILQTACPIVRVGSMPAAVVQADQLSQPGDVVLLSPACSSFDMFKNYEARGDIFMQCVHDLKGDDADQQAARGRFHDVP